MTVSKEAQAAADALKAKGGSPIYIVIAGTEFVYRPINRNEWRELKDSMTRKIAEFQGNEKDPDSPEAAIKLDQLREEEMVKVMEIAKVYYADSIDDCPAGVVDALSNAIMESSGFAGPETMPQKL